MLLCCAVLCSLLMKCAVSSSNSCECRVSERTSPAAPRPPFRLSSRPTRRDASPLLSTALLCSHRSSRRRVASRAALRYTCCVNTTAHRTQLAGRNCELRQLTDAQVSAMPRDVKRETCCCCYSEWPTRWRLSALLCSSIQYTRHPIRSRRIASHRIALQSIASNGCECPH